MSNRDDIPGMTTVTFHAAIFAKRVCFLILAITIGMIAYLYAGPSQEIKQFILKYEHWYCIVAVAIAVSMLIGAAIERLIK